MGRFDEAAVTWDDEPKLQRARRVADLLRATLPLAGTERVLDLGAGTGQLSLQLADAVGSVVVSDASIGMIEVAARNIEMAGLSDRFTAVQLDLTTDEAPGTFDGVWSMLALHHITELEVLLGKLHALLHAGGWIAIVDLDSDDDGAFHAHVGDDFHGHHGFDRDSLASTLAAAGFTGIAFTEAGVVDQDLEVHGHHEKRSFPMFLATATRA